MFGKVFVVFQEYHVVFQELLVVFADMGHRTLECSIGSLSINVFERRTSTGSGLFSFFDGGFAQIFSQIASIIVKKLRNSNFISSRNVKRENTSLPVDVRPSKTSLLKLPISTYARDRSSHG